MPTTTGYEFGDVVLVPFPFTDQSTTKQRPAVIISSAAYQRERALVRKRLGTLSNDDQQALRTAIGLIIG
jgi:mRNA-degrading endonuclease toxin of MazEF toxin-antitoxin module